MKKAFQIRTALFSEILELEKLIPEFTKETRIEEFLNRTSRARFLILVLVVNGKSVAYKVGYSKDELEFYSWLGAVIPEFRRRGYAQALLKYQESWARREGYKLISVKTSQVFPAMIKLLVRNSYQLCQEEMDSNHNKLLFVKYI